MCRVNSCLKKFIVGLTAVTMVVSAISFPQMAYAKSSSKSSATYAEGDNISLGKLDGAVLNWTILSYDDSTKVAFVVARKTLSSTSVTSYRKAINQVYYEAGTQPRFVMWKDNYWRGWCNQVFYTNCFNDDEKAMIQQTTLTASDAKASLLNFYHDTTLDAYYINNSTKNSFNVQTYNMQTDSTDYIFFLSTDEYTEYEDTMEFATTNVWPLRTNAYDDPAQSLFVNDKTNLIQRDYYYTGDGVRPAMYVKLGEADSDSDDTSTSSTDSDTSTESASTDSTTDTSTTSTSTTTASTTSTTTTTKSKSYANNATNIGDIKLPDDSTYSMSSGSTAQTAINLQYLNSTDKNYTVTYKSSNSSVFTVSSSGLVTAVGKGTATLTVKMKKSNGKTYTLTCRIDVT